MSGQGGSAETEGKTRGNRRVGFSGICRGRPDIQRCHVRPVQVLGSPQRTSFLFRHSSRRTTMGLATQGREREALNRPSCMSPQRMSGQCPTKYAGAQRSRPQEILPWQPAVETNTTVPPQAAADVGCGWQKGGRSVDGPGAGPIGPTATRRNSRVAVGHKCAC